MYSIYATKKLLDRMQEPIIDSIPDATNRLGNWFAKPLFWRPQVALFVNEETFLTVFASLAPASTLAIRFPEDLAMTLRSHGVPESFIEEELLAMDEFVVSRTNNRRVVGIMNELATMPTRQRPADVREEPYDGTMPWKEIPVGELAEEIAACLAKGDSSAATRLAFRFIERYDRSDWETRDLITAEPPQTTGSDRYDALVAGMVEFACASHGVVAPSWVNNESFFLSEWWFVSGVSSLHADALVHSPISLARRGVFVTQGALEYA